MMAGSAALLPPYAGCGVSAYATYFASPQPIAIVWCVERKDRADRNHAVRIDGLVAAEVVVADVVHPHGVGDARHLVDVAQQDFEVGIVADPLAIAFEMRRVYRVEAHQRGPQAQVRFGERVADQIAVLTEAPFE